MIKLALCDDETAQREAAGNLLREYAASRPALAIKLSIFSSGQELLAAAEECGGFDLYVLDIVMPGLSGIDLGVRLRELYSDGDIIYLTISPEYAVDSYAARAFYYLMKPVEPDKLFQVLDQAVAALEKFSPPIITIDMGTATTIGVISEGRTYEGGLLLPGVNVSLEALSRRAAQLPDISLQHPKALIGKNTEDCMRSGIVYGTAGMLDGIIDRIREEFPGREVSVVATGGNAPVIVRYCRNKILYDKFLLMDGLWTIYQKNR